MSEFINTADVIGDEAMTDQIISRTVTEYKENRITTVGQYAFNGCAALVEVDIPNVTSIGGFAFYGCTALAGLDLSNVTSIEGYAFQNCSSLSEAVFNSAISLGSASFANCTSLTKFSAEINKMVYAEAFISCSNLTAVILRKSESINELQHPNAFQRTPIASGTGYIYVPRALVDSYKVATNWSTFADQFRALEDYTVDGTITGKFKSGLVTKDLHGVSSSTTDTLAVGSYQTNLNPIGSGEIIEVSVTMDGVDITDSVYSDGVVSIPSVTGDIHIVAKSNYQFAVASVPLNGAEVGKLPLYRLDVKKGQMLRIYYYATLNGGYLYDGRGCTSGFKNSGFTLNTDSVQDVTIATNGTICFSCYYEQVDDMEGTVTTRNNGNDAFTGKYIYVEILK